MAVIPVIAGPAGSLITSRGGHYGYPYQFLTAPFRALPLMGGEAGEPGTQGVYYDEGGLPARFQGNLFVCDWSRQAVVCFEIRKAGGTFAVARQTTVVAKGPVADFHPLALAATADGSGFWLADWADNGWNIGRTRQPAASTA